MKAQEMPSFPTHEAEIYCTSLVTAKEVPEPICVKVAVS